MQIPIRQVTQISFPDHFPFLFGCRENLGKTTLALTIVMIFCIDSSISNAERRSKLYDTMARDLDEHGALFLKGGETSQSLSLSDIFTIKDGSVAPVLKVMCNIVRCG